MASSWVVGDMDEDRTDLALQAMEFVLHSSAKIQIECAERLVKQQDDGFDDQRTREGDALALATGHLVDFSFAETGESDKIQHSLHRIVDLAPRLAVHA